MFTSTASSITKMSALVSGVGTDAAIYDDPQDADIPTLLDSRYDADKAQGLKRLIALMAQGRDVSNYFPQVVKGVASQSLEVKKLVYIYLVHYADKRPDEALLSINSFQRDLSDINPVVRAWALRAMSGIKVRAVIPLVIMAAKKCARDPSPYVRRCAANAVSKIHSIGDEDHFDSLVELISILLNDNCAGVVGAAAAAYTSVCPEEYSLLKSNFRKLCNLLSEPDVWGQVALMDILMRYTVARHGVVRDYSEESSQRDAEYSEESRLLLSSTLPLLYSHNSAVVLQATIIHWFFSPTNQLKNIVNPLLFLLRSSYDAQHVVLANILSFSKCMPSLFESSYEEFFIRSSDSPVIRALKLDILTNIVADHSINQILQELEAYIRSPKSELAAAAVNAIGRCAIKLSSSAELFTRGLLRLAANISPESEGNIPDKKESYSRGDVVIQAVLALRAIVQKHPGQLDKVLQQLLRNLKHIKEPTAREVVIWMIGEHGVLSPLISKAIPLILQHLAKTFVDESVGTKLQILNCICKVVLSSKDWESSSKVILILQYILNLASCDLSYDVRDRARMMKKILTAHLDLPDTPLSTVGRSMFLSEKSVPVLPSLSLVNSSFLPGSISHIVQHMAPGYRNLPPNQSLESSEGEFIESGSESSGSISSKQESNDDCSEERTASSSGSENEEVTEKVDLISLSDNESSAKGPLEDAFQNILPSADNLESWLESSSNQVDISLASSIDFELKKVLALDFTNADGLEVQYSFTKNTSIYSPDMVCLRLFFHNKSLEPKSGIRISNEESQENQGNQGSFECGNAIVIPPEIISELLPEEKTECNIHIDFRHNLNPIKVWLHFNDKNFTIKITPEAGSLLRPRGMKLDEFFIAQSRISGMHRSSRRIMLQGIGELKTRREKAQWVYKGIISAANVAFVGEPSTSNEEELTLYFSAETLAGSLLCLISVILEGGGSTHGMLTVGCEDTLFGLALLNQLDKSLSSSR